MGCKTRAEQVEFSTALPIGVVMFWTDAAIPSGWLECDGSAVSRTTYAELFALVGTTFGVGDGSTTFNLPDLRGRTAIGAGTGDASDATAHALADKEGTETHTLTTGEMPSHTHGPGGGAVEFVGSVGAGGDIGPGGADGKVNFTATASAGSDGAHNNLQPSLTLHAIIFAGV